MQASQPGPTDEETFLRFRQQAVYCIQMTLFVDGFLKTQELFRIQNLISLNYETRRQRHKNSLSYSVRPKSYVQKTTIDIIKLSIIKPCRL